MSPYILFLYIFPSFLCSVPKFFTTLRPPHNGCDACVVIIFLFCIFPSSTRFTSGHAGLDDRRHYRVHRRSGCGLHGNEVHHLRWQRQTAQVPHRHDGRHHPTRRRWGCKCMHFRRCLTLMHSCWLAQILALKSSIWRSSTREWIFPGQFSPSSVEQEAGGTRKVKPSSVNKPLYICRLRLCRFLQWSLQTGYIIWHQRMQKIPLRHQNHTLQQC